MSQSRQSTAPEPPVEHRTNSAVERRFNNGPSTNYSGLNTNHGPATNYGGTNSNRSYSTNYGGTNQNEGPATNYGGTNHNEGPATNYGGVNYNYSHETTNRGGENRSMIIERHVYDGELYLDYHYYNKIQPNTP